MMKYLNDGSKKLRLHLQAIYVASNKMVCVLDTSFAVHPDFKSHTWQRRSTIYLKKTKTEYEKQHRI
jgi:hypothetical protein